MKYPHVRTIPLKCAPSQAPCPTCGKLGKAKMSFTVRSVPSPTSRSSISTSPTVPGTLLGPEESNARNSEPMFLNPLPHLLTRPCPFEWMGVQPIVLRPGLPHVIDKLGSTVPRSSLQVVVTECADQQLRFVEPRGVDRGEATSPPAGASRQIAPRLCGRMGRVVIVDQIDSAQVTMPMSECLNSWT